MKSRLACHDSALLVVRPVAIRVYQTPYCIVLTSPNSFLLEVARANIIKWGGPSMDEGADSKKCWVDHQDVQLGWLDISR